MIAMSNYILQSRVSEFNFNNCKAEMIPAVKICDTCKSESNAMRVDERSEGKIWLHILETVGLVNAGG